MGRCYDVYQCGVCGEDYGYDEYDDARHLDPVYDEHQAGPESSE